MLSPFNDNLTIEGGTRMDNLDKDMKLDEDKLSEAAVPDEKLDQVAGGTYEEFRRYGRKEDKDAKVVRKTKAIATDH